MRPAVFCLGITLLAGCSVTRAAPSSDEPASTPATESAQPAPARADPPCTPGLRRWCRGRQHGGFGIATCGDDAHWSSCVDSERTTAGRLDRPDNACACRYPSFDARCCEDQQDRDGDGRQDCIVPDDHEAPACESDGSLGAFCDSDSQCTTPSSAGLCLLADDGAQVYSFCSRPCSEAAACPTGWACVSVAASGRPISSQCFPASARPDGVLPVAR